MVRTKLSIVIANFNARDFLENCLASIFRHLTEPSFEVIVADNASRDGSVQMVRSRFPEVILEPLSENAGFGAASNIGAARAKGEYLLFTNSDTEILPDSALPSMVEYLDAHEDVGVAGPKLCWSKEGQIQRSWSGFPTIPFALIHYTSIRKPLGKSQKMREAELLDLDTSQAQTVEVISGSCLMIRKDLFESLRGFDEGFFLYFEEFDLCRRARKLGWKVVYFPGTKLLHYGGRSMGYLREGERSQAFEDSRRRFYRKHNNGISAGLLELTILMDRQLRAHLRRGGKLEPEEAKPARDVS